MINIEPDNLDSNKSYSDYTWSGTGAAAGFDFESEGYVRMKSMPATGDGVIIATPKDGGVPLEHHFHMRFWVTFIDRSPENWFNARNLCRDKLHMKMMNYDSFDAFTHEWGFGVYSLIPGVIGDLYWIVDGGESIPEYDNSGSSGAGAGKTPSRYSMKDGSVVLNGSPTYTSGTACMKSY